MELTTEYKHSVIDAIIANRKLFNGNDKAYAISMGINPSVYSRIKSGERDGLISESEILTIGRELEVLPNAVKWNVARTYVYNQLESIIKDCLKYAQSKIVVDKCGIGKTTCAKAIVKQIPKSIYIDCSQAKGKTQFVRLFAKKLGISSKGRISDIIDDIKYYLNVLGEFVVVLDEFGDLNYAATLLAKELWNGSEGNVGWLVMGAEGLKKKIEKGINSKKIGYAELFSRFASEYFQITPKSKQAEQEFWFDSALLILEENVENPTHNRRRINKIAQMTVPDSKDFRFTKDIVLINKLQRVDAAA